MDGDLVKQAKDNNLNMSALAEEAIKNALNETSNLQRLKIKKTKLKQQIEQNILELEKVEELIVMEIKKDKYNIKEDKYKIEKSKPKIEKVKHKIILGLFLIGVMGLLTFPFVSNNLINTSSDDFIIKSTGDGEVVIPNWLGTTTKLGNYSFPNSTIVNTVKLINPSYIPID